MNQAQSEKDLDDLIAEIEREETKAIEKANKPVVEFVEERLQAAANEAVLVSAMEAKQIDEAIGDGKVQVVEDSVEEVVKTTIEGLERAGAVPTVTNATVVASDTARFKMPEHAVNLPLIVDPTPAEPEAKAPAKLEPKLKAFVDPDEFARDTRLAEDNLDDAYYTQHGKTAFYGHQSSLAEQQYNAVKLRTEILEATLSAQYREAMLAAGEKATEKALDEKIKTDKQWQKSQRLKIEAKQIMDYVASCYEAIKERRYMIMGAGARSRDERQGDLRLVEQSQRDNARAVIRNGTSQ